MYPAIIFDLTNDLHMPRAVIYSRGVALKVYVASVTSKPHAGTTYCSKTINQHRHGIIRSWYITYTNNNKSTRLYTAANTFANHVSHQVVVLFTCCGGPGTSFIANITGHLGICFGVLR